MSTSTRIACLLLLAATAGASTAADVYRWIDADGRTQVSDVPPPKGTGPVTRTPIQAQPVAPDQQRAAQERTARDKDTLKGIEDERRRGAAKARKPAAAASSAEQEAGLPPRGSAEDCRNWRQEYSNSQACFAPYRNARGGIKAEAFAVCGPEVLDPSQECGLPRN
jgi:hypothetical protein